MSTLSLADIMSRQVVTCAPDCGLDQAAARMAERCISSLLVTQGERLLGVITERDILLAAESGRPHREPVTAIMSSPVLRAPLDMGLRDAFLLAARHRVRHVVVVDADGHLVGMVTETDFRHHLNQEVLRKLRTVEALLDRKVPCLAATDSLDQALRRMGASRSTCVVVLADGRPEGILTTRDVVRLFDRTGQGSAVPLGQVMTAPVHCVPLGYSALEAAHVMANLNLRHLAVVDGAGRYLGALSEHDLLRPLELDDLEELLDERNRMEASLDEVQAVAGLASWVLDVDSGRLTASRETYHLYGLPLDSPLTLDSLQDRVHPEDRERVVAAWGEALQGAAYVLDHRILRQGETRWLHVQARVLRDAGRSPRVLGTAQDITERKRTSLLLKLQHELARALMSGVDRDHLLQVLLTHALRLPELDVGCIFWRDPDGGYRLVRHQGLSAAFTERIAHLPPGSMEARLLQAGEQVCSCTEVNERCSHPELVRQDYVRAEGLRSLLTVPLRLGDVAVAALCVASRHGDSIPEGAAEAMDTLAAMIGQALARQQAMAEAEAARQRMEMALAGSAAGLWDWRVQTGEVTVDQRWAEIVGYDLDELAPLCLDTWRRLCHPHDLARSDDLLAQHFRGDTDLYECEARMRHKDGQWIWVLARGRVVERDAQGQPARVVGTHLDITRRKLVEAALEDSEARYRAVVEGMTDSLSVLDRDGNLLFVNPKAANNLCGGRIEAVRGHNIAEFVAPEDASELVARYRRVIDTGEPFQGETRIIMNGRERWFLNRLNPMLQPDGQQRVLSMSQDVSAYKAAEDKLRLAASVFEHAHEGILITDAEGRIVEVNQVFCELTGYERQEVLGRRPSLLQSGHHPPEFYQDMWRQLGERGHWQGELWNRRKTGELYAELLTISAVRGLNGEVSHYLGLFSDITVLKEHQNQLERMAHYDVLTQLPNRALLADRLRQAMPQALRGGRPLAICYLDLDGFKQVNDSLGHAAGDRLLLEVSQRLKGSVRSEDTVARLGGDEFVILLGNHANLTEVLHTLNRILAVLAAPYQLQNSEARISASLGVTLYPQDDADADTLIRHADQAMYSAKLAGRNRYHLFDPEQDRRARAQREALARVRQALAQREFVLYYQPKVDMRRGKVVGVEALIRWQHPERGLLPPAEFLPIVDESDLAAPLGDWVVGEALRQAEQWRLAGLDLSVSINIAARHLQQKGFVSNLREHLAAHPHLSPGQVELEILESVALEDMGRVSRIIQDCHELGVRIALDDFGTGYASLTYFRRLPVDVLKIDQSFVRDMLEDEEDYAIVEGVVGLTQAFQRQVVAEGVETSQHGMVLLRLGCDLAQGYGIARPMPAARLPDWVAAFRADPLWHSGLGYELGREDLPLLLAEHNHRAWVDAVIAYLRSPLDADASSPVCLGHEACAFGRWYHGSGLRRYGEHLEYQALGRIHAQVHATAGRLCQARAAGRPEEALAGLAELEQGRTDLLNTLAELIVAVSERQQLM